MEPITIAVVILAGGLILYAIMRQRTPNCPQPPASSSGIYALARAIAIQENSNPDWNNPGDLTVSFGFPHRGAMNSAGVLGFVNCEDGWNALYRQLELIQNGASRYAPSTSLQDFGYLYSGRDPNWAVNVAKTLGVTPDVTLADIFSMDFSGGFQV
jgi:hypothetical protein